MLLTVREACPCSPISFNLSRLNSTRFSQRLKTSVCRASFSVQPKPNAKSWNSTLNSNRYFFYIYFFYGTPRLCFYFFYSLIILSFHSLNFDFHGFIQNGFCLYLGVCLFVSCIVWLEE